MRPGRCFLIKSPGITSDSVQWPQSALSPSVYPFRKTSDFIVLLLWEGCQWLWNQCESPGKTSDLLSKTDMATVWMVYRMQIARNNKRFGCSPMVWDANHPRIPWKSCKKQAILTGSSLEVVERAGNLMKVSKKTSDLMQGKKTGAVRIAWLCQIARKNKRFYVKWDPNHHADQEK